LHRLPDSPPPCGTGHLKGGIIREWGGVVKDIGAERLLSSIETNQKIAVFIGLQGNV
jgi:hypothetical protein